MIEFYGAFKALHIIAVISWMAALLYLPRLFVYHSEQKDNIQFKQVVQIQEKRLYYGIGYPGMLLSIISGILMILSNPHLFASGGWLHAKLTFALLLIIFHFACGFYRRALMLDNYKSARFFRFFNEIPTLLMIGIVIMAVVKPF
ncbi:protoporphyrinogen oxidase HemJ [Helicobacter muridarum]|uniref:Protoporphyrinogen IX oxidase n=1 Tax=Helicobacter muridarum TaxID=216 RepID=A0A099U0R7_9HELI|nr:protoporphyrinogen oxidase HemJ [Helicobacter muridarum]TLE01704.1 protoporphyrinogen oxidase HemJ [Helicobacter muridarum]STQ86344.1 integral membrane protein [Helicobacter muridarum]